MSKVSGSEELKHREDGTKVIATPIPIIQVVCVCMVQMSEALNVELLFPFLAFMVEDMGYTGEALGYHAGILAATFCGAQFCTSVLWGVISDRYGRKAAIVAGTLGSGLGMLIFGFAKTFPQAVLGRVVGGLLCGNLGVVKSFLTEITDDTNRSPAFYWLSLSWAMGSVFAPLLGGMLSKPSENYPTVFSSSPDSLFVEYPYLLPCLFTVGVTVVASLLCWVFMIETVGASKEEIQARIAGRNTEYGPVSSGEEVLGTEQGLQMVPVDSSADAGAGDDDAYPKHDESHTSSKGYSRLPFGITGGLDYAADVREMDEDTSTDATTINPLQTTDSESEDGGNQLETLYEDQATDSLSSAGHDTTAPVTEGMSTAMLQYHGRVRNRSRSSSTTMPYPAPQDVESGNSSSDSFTGTTSQCQDRVWNRTVPYSADAGAGGLSPGYSQSWARNRTCSSSNTASFIDLEQPAYSMDHTGIAFRPRGGSTTSQWEVHNEVYSPTATNTNIIEERSTFDEYVDRDNEERGCHENDSAAVTYAETAVEEDESDEICCPAVFEFVAQVGRSLGCMSRTNAATALDGSVHSSQQLLGDSAKSSKGSVLVQRVVVLATMNYGMVSACSILIDETLPLYLKLDSKQGGFGFNTAQIGMLLSTGAAGMMLLTVVCMPLTVGVSNKWISFQSLAWSIPVELAFPLIALLNNEVLCDIHSRTERVWLLWPLLMLVNIVKNYFCCLSLTSAIMMVNHSVTDEYLGAVNGLGQSLGALARCLGPAVGGLLWSIGTRYNFVWLNFIFITLLYLLNMYVSDLVPKSLDYKKQPRITKQK